jgi:hypothetical protein
VNRLIAVLLLLFTGPVLAVHEPWVTETFPQDVDKWWWDDAWWQEGQLDRPENHHVTVEQISYPSGDVEVPAYLFRPTTPGDHLPVLFLHGRRGLDDLTLLLPRRLAARGFVVWCSHPTSGARASSRSCRSRTTRPPSSTPHAGSTPCWRCLESAVTAPVSCRTHGAVTRP